MKWIFFLFLLLTACSAPPNDRAQPTVPEPQAWILGYDSQDDLARLQARIGAPLALEPKLHLSLFRGFPSNPGGVRYLEPLGRGKRFQQPLVLGSATRGLSLPNTLQWYLEATGAPQAWTLSQGEGVVVALLDGWPDPNHPALRERLLPGYDPLTDRVLPLPGPPPDPHATAVASLLAGQGPVYGLAPKAKLLPIWVFQPEYLGDFYAARAIRYAVDAGAKVLSLSWGGLGYSQALYDAVVYALERGVSIVAAAGNLSLGVPFYPAAYPGVVGVWSTGPAGTPSPFSNWGRWFTLGAPGERILAATVNGETAFWEGTSFATPLVAGGISLSLARNPGWPYAVRSVLKTQSTLDVARLVATPPQGYGACLQLRVFRPDPESPIGRSPVPRAEIALEGPETLRLLTDAQGRGRLYQVAPGNYRLRVAGQGSQGWVLWEEDIQLASVCPVEHYFLLP